MTTERDEMPVQGTVPMPKTPEHILKTAAIALEMEGYIELANDVRSLRSNSATPPKPVAWQAVSKNRLVNGLFTADPETVSVWRDTPQITVIPLYAAPAATPLDLLKRARQFVADAGCDEDDHDVYVARDELLADIDAAVSRPAPEAPAATPPDADMDYVSPPGKHRRTYAVTAQSFDITDEVVERGARAMAENAGFAWEACAQSQWISDMRAGLAAVTHGERLVEHQIVGVAGGFDPRSRARSAHSMPKFDKTFCSSCGREFGPGDHGFSHCDQHRTNTGKRSRGSSILTFRDALFLSPNEHRTDQALAQADAIMAPQCDCLMCLAEGDNSPHRRRASMAPHPNLCGGDDAG